MKMSSMNCSGCKPVNLNNAHVNLSQPIKQKAAKPQANCTGCGPKGVKFNKTA